MPTASWTRMKAKELEKALAGLLDLYALDGLSDDNIIGALENELRERERRR